MAEAGVKEYNFSNVNKSFGTNFNNQQQFIGFSMGYAENFGGNYYTVVHWFPTVESKPNDSVSAALKGYLLSFRGGKDVLRSKKYDLVPGLGLGFERWTTTITEKFASKDILGNERTTQYTNPAFFMDAGLSFRAHISWITLGFFGRYQLDFSNRKWRQNGDIVDNSPKFSLNAYSLGVSLGFNFEP